jgi:hypothetical protein
MLETLLKFMKEPLRTGIGVKTDDSILLVYPPERELDFREQLSDSVIPALEAQQSPFHALDLSDFLFTQLREEDVEQLKEDEFDDYHWMIQGLSKRAESLLQAHLADIAARNPGSNIIVYATVALHPLVRFAEVLRGLRDLPCRIALAFPGEERGGKLHFLNLPDGGNYLAIKIFWR